MVAIAVHGALAVVGARRGRGALEVGATVEVRVPCGGGLTGLQGMTHLLPGGGNLFAQVCGHGVCRRHLVCVCADAVCCVLCVSVMPLRVLLVMCGFGCGVGCGCVVSDRCSQSIVVEIDRCSVL